MEVTQVQVHRRSQRMAHAHLGYSKSVLIVTPASVLLFSHSALSKLAPCLDTDADMPNFTLQAYLSAPTTSSQSAASRLSSSRRRSPSSARVPGPKSSTIAMCASIPFSLLFPQSRRRVQKLSPLQAFGAWLAVLGTIASLEVAFVFACRVRDTSPVAVRLLMFGL
jgi:hypothetical protein